MIAPIPISAPGATTTPSPIHTFCPIKTCLLLSSGRSNGGISGGRVGAAVLPVIVIGDDDLAANKNPVANFDTMGRGNVAPSAHGNIVADANANAVVRRCADVDRLQPQAFGSMKVSAQADVAQSAQMISGAKSQTAALEFALEREATQKDSTSAPYFARKDEQPIGIQKPRGFCKRGTGRCIHARLFNSGQTVPSLPC